MEKIVWTKEYQEDLGGKNEDGNYEYAYRYFTYWFSLPNNQKVRARRYTDTPELCSIYVALDELEQARNSEASTMKHYVSGIINFLIASEGVKKIQHFSQDYKPVDLSTIKDNLKDFTFVEEKAQHN